MVAVQLAESHTALLRSRWVTHPRVVGLLPGLGAIVAGLLTGLSWQPYGLWPLLAIGVPGLTLLTRRGRPRAWLVRGFIFGAAMLAVGLSWIHVLGIGVAVLLVLMEAGFFGLLGVGLGLVQRLRAWPVAAACCWVGVEFLYSRVPFGGFGWMRIAYAAVDSPLAGFFPIVGVTGVSFFVALIAQLLVYLVVQLVQRVQRGSWGDPAGRRGPALVVVATVALVILPLAGWRLQGYQVEPESGQGAVSVGIVQGNVPGRGIEAFGRARTVTANHIARTADLMSRVRAGQVARPDFLLWPENSTDIDPARDALTQQAIQAAAQAAGVPILVGAVMQGPGVNQRQTSALWWDPRKGVSDRYDKRNLVPFGEWIPFRDQLLPLVPALAQVGAQSIPGTQPGVLQVSVAGRQVKVGDVICFELAYDQTVYDTVTNGAEISLVQSNNATYGGTGQIEQQFAITRARAMELRREISVATTNSVSGLINRNGQVLTRTREFSADDRVVTMPLRSALTPAVRLGPWLGPALTALAVLSCAFASSRWHRPGRSEPTLAPASKASGMVTK